MPCVVRKMSQFVHVVPIIMDFRMLLAIDLSLDIDVCQDARAGGVNPPSGLVGRMSLQAFCNGSRSGYIVRRVGEIYGLRSATPELSVRSDEEVIRKTMSAALASSLSVSWSSFVPYTILMFGYSLRMAAPFSLSRTMQVIGQSGCASESAYRKSPPM